MAPMRPMVDNMSINFRTARAIVESQDCIYNSSLWGMK